MATGSEDGVMGWFVTGGLTFVAGDATVGGMAILLSLVRLAAMAVAAVRPLAYESL